MKRCSKCKCEWPVSQFGKNRSMKDGLDAWCLPCRRDYMRPYMREYMRPRWQADDKRNIEAVSDKYVKGLIRTQTGTPAKHIPQPLIELTRIHIKLKREVRKNAKDQ